MKFGLGLGLNRLGSLGGGSVNPMLTIPNVAAGYSADAIAADPAHNDPVASWTDLSGNGRHAVTNRGAPIFKTNILNGRPGVYFDGSKDLLTSAFLNAAFNKAITVVTLSYNNTVSPGPMWGTPTALSSGFLGGYRGRQIGEYFFGGVGNKVTANAQPDNTPICDFYSYGGTAATIRNNRQDLESIASTANIGFVGNELCIGSWGFASGVGYSHVGHIFEFWVYNRQLTRAEKRFIESHFRRKYGVLNKSRIICVGDSIFGMTAPNTVNPSQIMAGNLGAGYLYDFAVLQTAGYHMITEGITYKNLILDDILPADNILVNLQLAVNDINDVVTGEALWALDQSWAAALSAAGVQKQTRHTATPDTAVDVNPLYESRRQTHATLLRAGYLSAGFNGIVDVAANTTIGDQADADNPTYFIDKVHPTNAGATIMGGLMSDKIIEIGF